MHVFKSNKTAYSFEIAGLCVLFAWFLSYFATIRSQVTVVSPTILKGQNCTVLSPKKGTLYYSKNTSENAQFASPYMLFDECVAHLKSLKVCDDGYRNDVISLSGITFANNSQYLSSGYLLFSPTNTRGLTSAVNTFYTSSSSFPRPDITSTFSGTEKTMWAFNMEQQVRQIWQYRHKKGYTGSHHKYSFHAYQR